MAPYRAEDEAAMSAPTVRTDRQSLAGSEPDTASRSPTGPSAARKAAASAQVCVPGQDLLGRGHAGDAGCGGEMIGYRLTDPIRPRGQPAGPRPTRTDSEYAGAVKVPAAASRVIDGGWSREGFPLGPAAFHWY